MATHSATLIWGRLRHPLRSLQQQWQKRQLQKHLPAKLDRSPDQTSAPVHRCQSPERLERIAAYARCGYFHMEYTAGMFVVPLDVPSE